MLEKPKRKKIDKQENTMPTNIEQLIEKYDLEGMWPYIESVSICDMGTNENGTYVKFGNGLMICYKKITLSGVAVNTASGSLYVSSATSLGNYPHRFAEKPVLQTTLSNGSSSGWISGIGSIGGNFIGNATFTRTVSTTSATFHVDIMAIGKWK